MKGQKKSPRRECPWQRKHVCGFREIGRVGMCFCLPSFRSVNHHVHDLIMVLRSCYVILQTNQTIRSDLSLCAFLSSMYFTKFPLFCLPQAFGVLVSFNNLLQAINCSVNFLIYYGHRFRSLGEWQRLHASGGKNIHFPVHDATRNAMLTKLSL